MPVTQDIVATYKGPRRVFRQMLAMGQREDRALIIVMSACVVVFISQWPVLARKSHLTGDDLQPLLGGALMAWLFVAPLALYGVAALSHIVAKIFRGQGDWFGARLALFWAMLASSPLILLNGLVGGFIGAGPALTLVGMIWFGIFMWFWMSCLIEAERP